MTVCTVVVPTRDRHHLLRDAVDSALGQVDADVEVLVVDDGSRDPVDLPADPRLRTVRHLRSRGVSAARNLGISLARTPYVAFLDDDDRLRPRMVATSLATLADSDAPAPVAALSAVAVIAADGTTTEVRTPPRARPRGDRFSLEPLEPGRSYFSKQTLVVPRQALLAIGGFDERFRSRVVTELFWRLNEVCSIVGSDEVTYELRAHPGPRLSGDRRLRQRSFRQLLDVHGDLLRQHPDGFADLLAQHARNSLAARQPAAAAAATLRWAGVRIAARDGRSRRR